MGVDLFVMPLARYHSGEYITPMMQLAWDRGLDFHLLRPDGRIVLPPGQPLGGRDAGDVRREYVQHTHELFDALAEYSADPPWDEADEGAIGAWRPSADGFGRLVASAAPDSHFAGAKTFLPIEFPRVLHTSMGMLGSLAALAREVTAIVDDEDFDDAHRVMSEAIRWARERRLPLHVDD